MTEETGEQKIENLTKAIKTLTRKLEQSENYIRQIEGNFKTPNEAQTADALNTLLKHNETCTDPDCIIKTKLQKLTPKTEGIKCEDCGEEVPKGKYCINCGEEIPEETEEGSDNWF